MHVDPDNPLALVSLGHFCALMQIPPGRLRKLLAECGVRPVITLNGTPHFDESAVELVRNHLAGRQPHVPLAGIHNPIM